MNFISLGAGVQSSTLALMASVGIIKPMPDAAIFADTQAEPRAVYEWLDWLVKQLAFPVVIATKGNLREDSLIVRRSKKSGRLYHNRKIPAFTVSTKGSPGITPRECTKDYKISIIQRESRRLLGRKSIKKSAGVLANSWIGISTDEAHRMKPSPVPWLRNWWPLIDLRMSRQDCLDWMAANAYPTPPRSACVFCPYHSDAEWIRLRDQSPDEFQEAIEYERAFRAARAQSEVADGDIFLHDSRVPLDQVAFSTTDPKDRMGNECEGICGV